MKKLINVRLPFLIACFLIAGTGIGLLFITEKISLLWIIAVVPLTAIIFIFTLLFSSRRRLGIIIVLCGLFLIVGAVNCFLRLDAYSTKKLTDNQTYTISATVYDKGETASGEYIIVKNARTGAIKIDGKIRVYLGETYGSFCDVGYKVEFTARVRNNQTFEYGKLNTYAEDNIKYICTVNGGLEAKRGFSFFGSIRSAVKSTLYGNLDGEAAAVAYAMLTGNTQGIDDGTLSTFRYGGIAHIFAVSGLHIGIVYGILCFILKRLRLNRFLCAALCLAPVLLYTGVCGFTVSSLRAFIMCAVSATAKVVYKKYDGLNALSLSVILILAVNPLNAFSVGFQLSVCAVAAIQILKLPRKFPKALRMPLAAQAGTLPVLITNFGYLSGAGLILNIILVPLLSALFVVLFIGTAVCTVVPALSAVLPYTALPLQAVLSFLSDAGFEKSLISGFGAGLFVPLYYLGLLAVSDKINLKLAQRLIAAACAVCFIAVYVILRNIYPFGGYSVTVSGYRGGGCVLIKSHGENVLIIDEGTSAERTAVMLNEYYASGLSAVVVLGGENCVSVLDGFGYNCKVYVYGGYINLPYAEKLNYEMSFSAGNVNFTYADGYSIIADCGGVEIAVCAGGYVPFESCDLLITDCAQNQCVCKYAVAINEQSVEYNVYSCGNLNFNVKNQSIEMK